MADELPAGIVVTEERNGVTTYDFPARQLGKWRWLGLLPLAIGGGIVGFAIFWTVGFVDGMRQIFGEWGGLGALVAIPFATGGLTVIAIGLAVLIGRSRLLVTESHLIPFEKIGWFPWRRRKIARSQITRLVVQAGVSGRVNGEPREMPALDGLSVLMAEASHGKKHILVPGYPREWLVRVANHLSQLLAIDADSAEDSSRAVPVNVVDLSTLGEGEPNRWEQPAGSRVNHQELEEGCVFTVPAPGVWRGSKGLFAFSLLWCGFMAVFTAGAGAAFAGGNAPKDAAIWIFPLFTAAFWAIGIGMMVGAINMGRRQAAIAVANGKMKSIVSGLFGTTRKKWRLTELQTARMGRSGMEVNDVPVMQLHIVPRDGSKYGLLTGLDEAELEWIATHLRRFLRSTDETDSDREPA